MLRVPTRVRYAECAEEPAVRFVPVLLLVAVQASAGGLGDAEGKSEASPRPTQPTKVGARNAAGSTRSAEPDGSGRAVSSPRRSAPLRSTRNRTKLPSHSVLGLLGCSGLAYHAATQNTPMWARTLPQCEYSEYRPEL